ncbi:MAG: hypothetical protein U0Q16_26165 [Bryobacteraceae bacterium]
MPQRLFALLIASVAAAQVAQLRSTFEVRYVTAEAVYLNGGRDEGLQEGFHLAVKRLVPGAPALSAEPVARLVVTAVAAHSAVCHIESSTTPVQTGDIAEVASEEMEISRVMLQSKTARRYGQVVTFTEGDPLEQEQRDYVPRPPSPVVNRAQARVSFEYSTLADHTLRTTTDQQGVVIRADVTRIAGSFWNLTGYWRGRLNSRYSAASQTQTIRDMVNRTYHIGLHYNNPESAYTIGAGRLLIPWAASLSTIDGAYFGRRLAKGLTAGAFGGSTPDPTAWDYKPGRQIAGSFLAFEAGDFENVRFTESAGIAMSRLNWKAEREYAFLESNLSWKQNVSVYYNLQADRLTRGRLGNTESGAALSRSFLTFRVQPVRWLAIDVNHNYFRTVPTFDLVLIGTGLLDRFLFTGLSGGVRIEPSRNITLYGTVGQNSRSGDPGGSLSQMYGVTFRNVASTGFRADVRRSVFHSPIASGWYQSVSLSRDIANRLRFEIQGGDQELRSAISRDNRALWMTSTLDWFLGTHYVLGAGWNTFHGSAQTYDQLYLSIGYRY